MNREKQIAGKWKTMIDGNIQKWDSIVFMIYLFLYLRLNLDKKCIQMSHQKS